MLGDAAVGDARTAVLVLRPADRRVGRSAVRRAELRRRDAGELRPERVGGVEIETLVQIEPQSQSALVDVEERAQPAQEEVDHPWVAVRETQLSWRVRSLAGVQRGPGDEQVAVGQVADAVAALGQKSLDLV